MQQLGNKKLTKKKLLNPLILVVIVLTILLFFFFYFFSPSNKEENQGVSREKNAQNRVSQKLKVVSGDASKQKLLVAKDQEASPAGKIKISPAEKTNGSLGGQIQDQLQLGGSELQGKNVPDLQQIEKPANSGN